MERRFHFVFVALNCDLGVAELGASLIKEDIQLLSMVARACRYFCQFVFCDGLMKQDLVHTIQDNQVMRAVSKVHKFSLAASRLVRNTAWVWISGHRNAPLLLMILLLF